MHSHDYTSRQLYGRRFIEGEADAFIHGKREGLARALGRMLVSGARDALAALHDGDFRDLPRIPVRRAVYHWAYLQGHRHGTRRRLTGDPDPRFGQRIVLDRHESKR